MALSWQHISCGFYELVNQKQSKKTIGLSVCDVGVVPPPFNLLLPPILELKIEPLVQILSGLALVCQTRGSDQPKCTTQVNQAVKIGLELSWLVVQHKQQFINNWWRNKGTKKRVFTSKPKSVCAPPEFPAGTPLWPRIGREKWPSPLPGGFSVHIPENVIFAPERGVKFSCLLIRNEDITETQFLTGMNNWALYERLEIWGYSKLM